MFTDEELYFLFKWNALNYDKALEILNSLWPKSSTDYAGNSFWAERIIHIKQVLTAIDKNMYDSIMSNYIKEYIIQ